ncbi:MAG: DNA adenine methylase [Deltaproteobacteria bacterium]|nr:DNA adenine methylase [Deltaproteobacteria bacterium]
MLREARIKSYLSYYGGKSRLAERIASRAPEHTCYCEVFAGAAWVLFEKEESKVEIINDINADLVTLYRVVKHHLDELIRYFRWILIARDEFERFKIEKPETLTDIQRAVRFYYLLKNGYSSIIANPRFSINTTRRANFNLLRIEEELSAAHLRLSRVYIENLHFEAFIRRFDRPHTFFYIDPPYYGHENDYGKGVFSRNDFDRLAVILKGLRGKFILSLNDTKDVRRLFSDFYMEKVRTTYTAASKSNKQVMELLITNYRSKRTSGRAVRSL